MVSLIMRINHLLISFLFNYNHVLQYIINIPFETVRLVRHQINITN